jgi:hypothetical protein
MLEPGQYGRDCMFPRGASKVELLVMRSQCRLSKRAAVIVAAAVVMAGLSQAGRADAITDAINAASARLVGGQVVPAATTTWEGPMYTGYNGTIIAGLTSAYRANGVVANKLAAEAGGTALIADAWANAGGNLNAVSYASNEVYGLTQVAALQSIPSSSTYYSAARDFFTIGHGSDVNAVVTALNTGNSAMLGAYGYSPLDKTLTTVNLAQYTAAAYAVNAPNKAAYRSSLITMLGQVADLDSVGSQNPQYCPTQALGAAVWALAKTGNGLDSTVITGPTGLTDPLQNSFGGKMLSELPGMLDARLDSVSHTFFVYLNFADYYAYTEDVAFGILGLDAADFAGHTSTYAGDIAAARLALSGAVDLSSGSSSGTTYDSCFPMPESYSGGEYAGMALQALAASPVPEPASVSLLALGAAGLLTRRRRSRNCSLYLVRETRI